MEAQIKKKLIRFGLNLKRTTIFISYFNYIYETTTFEQRIFKLASFLETFHRISIPGESSKIYADKVRRKERILEINNLNLNSDDGDYLKARVSDTSPSLKERFVDLIEPFSRLIFWRTPIFSYIQIEEIRKIEPNENIKLKDKIGDIIKKKQEIDLIYSDSDRDIRYDDLIKVINSDCKLKYFFLLYGRFATSNFFSELFPTIETL